MLFWLTSVAIADRPAFLVGVTGVENPDPLSLLITYGPLGIFIFLLATGQFRTKYEVQRLEKQIDRLVAVHDREIDQARSELREAHALIQAFQMQLTGHALPALAKTAEAFRAIPVGESDLIAQLRQAQEDVADLATQLAALGKGDLP